MRSTQSLSYSIVTVTPYVRNFLENRPTLRYETSHKIVPRLTVTSAGILAVLDPYNELNTSGSVRVCQRLTVRSAQTWTMSRAVRDARYERSVSGRTSLLLVMSVAQT